MVPRVSANSKPTRPVAPGQVDAQRNHGSQGNGGRDFGAVVVKDASDGRNNVLIHKRSDNDGHHVQDAAQDIDRSVRRRRQHRKRIHGHEHGPEHPVTIGWLSLVFVLALDRPPECRQRRQPPWPRCNLHRRYPPTTPIVYWTPTVLDPPCYWVVVEVLLLRRLPSINLGIGKRDKL
jgi:hypothetical protein